MATLSGQCEGARVGREASRGGGPGPSVLPACTPVAPSVLTVQPLQQARLWEGAWAPPPYSHHVWMILAEEKALLG